jgi:hypothetical protein
LVMALIAGIQNADERTIHYCLEKLCRPDRRDRAAMAAGRLRAHLEITGLHDAADPGPCRRAYHAPAAGQGP